MDKLPAPQRYGAWYDRVLQDKSHSTNVASVIAGEYTGVCGSGVTIIGTRIKGQKLPNPNDPDTPWVTGGANFMYIEALTQILEQWGEVCDQHVIVVCVPAGI